MKLPRGARFIVEDGTYHIMTRGNNREKLFLAEDDFEQYLNIVKETKEKYNLLVYHYVLMDNHVHKIIKISDKTSLSEGMKRINLMYTQYFRKRYGGIGHFYQDRYKSFLIEEGRYLLECGRYIELNPVKAGTVREPKEYKWTSCRVYTEGERNEIIDFNPEYEGLSDKKEMRMKIYREYLRDGINDKRNEERYFKEGVYGSQEFVEKMKEEGLKTVWSHAGRPKNQKEVVRA